MLDSKLQDTIYQFDHVLGVVECIDVKKHASDLRDAINSGKRIFITTLQKFSVIYNEVETDGNNYAIIVDEAHSSETGEAAVLEEETDPNVIYDLKNNLDSYQIYQQLEIDKFAKAYYSKGSKNVQATDRAHRIGQEKTVEVIKLLAKGTIEEKIYNLQQKKKEIIQNVINESMNEDNVIAQMAQEDLQGLFV